MFKKYLGRIAVVLLSIMLATSTVFASSLSSAWPSAGHDLQNTRNQSSESKINSGNVAGLQPAWVFTTSGDISATPALDGTNAYFPDWGGHLYAVNQKTGAQVWSVSIGSYTGIAGDYARATPAVVGNALIIGDQGGKFLGGAYVMAISRKDGSLIWKTQVESHLAAIVTQSAVIDQSTSAPVAYVGVASFDEALAAIFAGYTCCTFRGSILALDVATGKILWKTYMMPSGYSGGAVWGSTPVIDYKRGSLYIGTGNNYTVPPDVQTCIGNANGDPAAEQACISPDDHFDSVMALDLHTGAIKWATRALPFDNWTVACVFGFINPSNCPTPAGPDYDFGQGPILYTLKSPMGMPYDLLGDGEKSGQYWAFNPDTGAVVWSTQVGPGGITGGLQWGSAMDGTRIYVADANSLSQAWKLVQNGVATNTTVTSGFWSALDPASGKILWQTANPTGAQAPGAVSVANGVVYGCSADATGHMFALDAGSGNIQWSFASGGACAAGAAISNGVVYWGSGYSQFFTGNNQFFAFSLP